jgi:RimJ/RimL family protein N-acetyltransferase
MAFSLVRCGADGNPLQPIPTIIALTLQEHNASTKILKRLGFKLFGNARDPDAGDVWEWRT